MRLRHFLWGDSIDYLLGAIVLGHSIRKTNTKHNLLCLHAPELSSSPAYHILQKFWQVREIEHLPATSEKLFSGWKEQNRFCYVFTKLHALNLVEYDKVLVLDIDMIVRGNIDCLFDDENLRAPAALRRGANNGCGFSHGAALPGEHFFQGVNVAEMWDIDSSVAEIQSEVNKNRWASSGWVDPDDAVAAKHSSNSDYADRGNANDYSDSYASSHSSAYSDGNSHDRWNNNDSGECHWKPNVDASGWVNYPRDDDKNTGDWKPQSGWKSDSNYTNEKTEWASTKWSSSTNQAPATMGKDNWNTNNNQWGEDETELSRPLEKPANNSNPSAIDAVLDDNSHTSWFQGTGINAGVMLFRPNRNHFHDMATIIKTTNHPSHINTTAPEQDFLSRYYADKPWHNISVAYNYQLHQVFHQLTPGNCAERKFYLLNDENMAKIKVFHYSGGLKPWHHITYGGSYQRMSCDEFVRETLKGFDTYRKWYLGEGWDEDFEWKTWIRRVDMSWDEGFDGKFKFHWMWPESMACIVNGAVTTTASYNGSSTSDDLDTVKAEDCDSAVSLDFCKGWTLVSRKTGYTVKVSPEELKDRWDNEWKYRNNSSQYGNNSSNANYSNKRMISREKDELEDELVWKRLEPSMEQLQFLCRQGILLVRKSHQEWLQRFQEVMCYELCEAEREVIRNAV